MARGTVRRAARLIAHYEDVRRVPPYDRRLGSAFEGFFKAMVKEMDLGGDGLHIRLPKAPEGIYGRTIHLYGVIHDGEPVASMQLNDQDQDEKERTPERLRDLAIRGDTGKLTQRDVWGNPYIHGAIKSQVTWVGAEPLWSACGIEGAGTARLAWEALWGGRVPWRWHFELQETHPTFVADGRTRNPKAITTDKRQEWCKKARRLAVREYPRVYTPPVEIPSYVLRTRGDATMTQAIVYHLLEDPQGPGLAKTRAAELVGYGDKWRNLNDALDGYFKHHPDADRWPEEAKRPHEIKEIQPRATMAHH